MQGKFGNSLYILITGFYFEEEKVLPRYRVAFATLTGMRALRKDLLLKKEGFIHARKQNEGGFLGEKVQELRERMCSNC